VKKFAFIAVLLSAIMLTFAYDVKSADSEPCKKYTIVFEGKVKSLPSQVYAGGEKIGSVDAPQGQEKGIQKVPVCIEGKHVGKIEKNSICYVSKDQIVIYNVWPTGIDLKEGESIKGFTSRFELYIYEAQELLVLVKDAVTALVLELFGNILGDGTASRMKQVYEVIAK